MQNTTFVNRQPGAEERWEKTLLVFCTLVWEVCGGVVPYHPSLDLIILREAHVATFLQTTSPQGPTHGPQIPFGLDSGTTC